MKVVHITKLPDGGATWCAMRISKALQKSGIESSMLMMQGAAAEGISIAKPDWLYTRFENPLLRILMKGLKVLVRPRYEYYKWRRKQSEKSEPAFFSSPLTDYTRLPNHPSIKQADIVHLHGVADFVDYPSFFQKTKKPIVWTIHDENPGMGGFHYQLHQLQSNAIHKKLDKEYATIKKKAISKGNKPHLVAISIMMKGFLEHNDILKGCHITLIHNGVEGDQYQFLDRVSARENTKLPLDKKIFLFSSYKIEDKRKGLSLLIEALERQNDDTIHLVCLGKYESVPKAKIGITCAGLVRDKEQLSQYYSAADFFVLSSFQEAFAQTPLEAMSCGTPVISFPCSGAADLIRDYNGVLCNDFTVNALYDGINKAMSKSFNREQIRKEVLDRFSYDKIAEQYIKLYNSLLSE